jgi:hypothetical protein
VDRQGGRVPSLLLGHLAQPGMAEQEQDLVERVVLGVGDGREGPVPFGKSSADAPSRWS